MTRDRFAPHPPGRAARHRTRAAPGVSAFVACCALVAFVPLTAARPAGADEVAELRRARDRLGVELAQLRRLTPDEEAAPGQGAATPGGQRQQAPLGQVPWAQAPPGQPAQGQQTPERAGGEQGRLAGFEVRLSRIEEELRNLTGRIEQAEFEQRRVNERLERLVADLDARFSAIEGGGAA
ncbi:MAG TPA: hypothetical protein VFG47_08685, partial [Geminicoccaceae bacterium]|nr:hypothetical protein [Geminicoccaceae bacterium]